MDPTFRITDLVGTSSDSIDQAIRAAVDRAGQTLRNVDWFELVSVRGRIAENQVAQYQVQIKVGFRLDTSG